MSKHTPIEKADFSPLRINLPTKKKFQAGKPIIYANIKQGTDTKSPRYYLRAKDVGVVNRTPPDPEDTSDERNEYGDVLEIRLKKTDPFAVKYMELCNAVKTDYQALYDGGSLADLIQGSKLKKDLINPDKWCTMYYDYSTSDNEELRKEYGDYINIKLKVDFSTYPEAFKSKAGQVKTKIYDADTKRLDKNDNVVYDIASVDGEPICKANYHKFVTKSSEIKRLRMEPEQVTVSKFGISFKVLVTQMIIKHNDAPTNESEFDVEDDEAEELKELLAMKKRTEEARAKFADSEPSNEFDDNTEDTEGDSGEPDATTETAEEPPKDTQAAESNASIDNFMDNL